MMAREIERVAKKDIHFMPKIGGDVHNPDEIARFVRDAL